MASTIKIKRSGVSGKQPNTASLSVGELAINYKDQKLYSSNGTSVFEIGASSGSSGLVSITTATVKNLTQNDTVVTNVGVVAANAYLQVANAVSTYLTKNNPVITGTLTANGSTGTSGHYLRTSGTGVYWSPVSASGIHPQHAQYYIRRVRSDKKDPLTAFMIEQGIPSEPCVMRPDSTTVFSFPMKAPEGAITRDDVDAISHLKLWRVYHLPSSW